MEQPPEAKVVYSSYTPAQARANKKWKEKNKDKYQQYQIGYSRNYYEQNKETIRAKNLERYHRKKAIKLQEYFQAKEQEKEGKTEILKS